MTTPLSAYQGLVKDGTLAHDAAQEEVARTLDVLSRALVRQEKARSHWFKRTTTPLIGVYLWGGVGVGKSLLMDLFVQHTAIKSKRRVHFHAFMQEVHAFIADWRAMDDSIRKKHPARAKGASLDDPIPHAAKMVCLRAKLFCFDEFHVTDIADAMLLGRLFAALFDQGVVIVATSNRPPHDLYKNGINRGLFLPFIELIEDRMSIHHLAGARDYRMDRLENEPVYFSPLSMDAELAMDRAWSAMTAGATGAEAPLTVHGRELTIPLAARDCARANFDYWCRSDFGPADYLAIARSFPTVFIDDIPILSPEERNAATRFVTFIDALYEAHCTLFCSADARPEALYVEGTGAFEFERTASRLNEMQSRAYLHKSHISKRDPKEVSTHHSSQ